MTTSMVNEVRRKDARTQRRERDARREERNDPTEQRNASLRPCVIASLRLFCVFASLLAACGRKTPAARQEQPSALSAESALANSRLPGASGVGKAMKLQDSALARRRREDSISNAVP